MDFFALLKLKEKGYIEKNSFFVNGQSGDFISANHIPEILSDNEKDKNYLFEEIIKQNYSLWKNKLNSKNIKYIKNKINKKFETIDINFYNNLSLYEFWEYDERQSKFIINGQRNYEFLGLHWFLPFWDIRVVDFFRNLNYDYKIKQKFYRNYLSYYNFRNIFQNNNFTIKQWSGIFYFITILLILIKFILGKKIRSNIQKIINYFGFNHYLYSIVKFKEFFKQHKNIRNPYSFWSFILINGHKKNKK